MNNPFKMALAIATVSSAAIMNKIIKNSKVQQVFRIFSLLFQHVLSGYASILVSTNITIWWLTGNYWIDLVYTGVWAFIILALHSIFASSIAFSSIHNQVVVSNERFIEKMKNLKIDAARKSKACAYWSRKAKSLHNIRRKDEYIMRLGLNKLIDDAIDDLTTSLKKGGVDKVENAEVKEGDIIPKFAEDSNSVPVTENQI